MKTLTLHQNKLRAWRRLPGAVYRLLNGIVLLSLVVFPFATMPALAEEGNPEARIVVQIDDNWIRAEQFAPQAELTFEIYEDSSGAVLIETGTGWTDEGGTAWFSLYDPVDLVPGNYIVVTDGETTKTLILEAFTYDRLDLINGNVHGTAPAPYERSVWVGVGFPGDGWSLDLQTDEYGSWSGSFGGSVPANLEWTAAQIFDGEGDASEVRPAEIFGDWVGVYTFDLPPGSWLEGDHQYYITDNLGSSGDLVSFNVSPAARLFGGYVLLRGGFLVASTGDGCEQISQVHPSQPTRFHSGWLTPEPMTYAEAEAHFAGLSAMVVVDGDEDNPISLGLHEIRLFSYDTWWDYVCASTEPGPVPTMTVFPEEKLVEGWNWQDGADVSIQIAGKESCYASGLSSVPDWSNGVSWFLIGFEAECEIAAGDALTASDGVTTLTHMVGLISVTEVNHEANTLSGIAEGGKEVFTWVHGEENSNTSTIADEDGAWQVDFGSVGYDLLPGQCGRAEVRDEQGNATTDDWCAPVTLVHYFRDGLPDPWYWVNENEDGWYLDEENGLLVIEASSGGTGSENLLLRPVAEGDFMIKTRVFFEPQENYQFAGLVIYQDAENFFQLGRAFCDHEGFCAENAIYFDNLQSGELIGTNYATAQPVFDEAYLRLERRGNWVTGFFSQEGITWTMIGAHELPDGFQVNAVGLTAAQDNDEETPPIGAAFEFFELGEGVGFLPEGYHDYDGGDVPSWACNVGGWAADPDNRQVDLAIEVVVDGVSLPEWLYAGEYREDLAEAGVCEDGHCSFHAGLWDQISSYEEHSIVVYAQDVPSGEWVQLNSSPKNLTCRTYDIYTYNPQTGETNPLTDLRWADEYSPSWSANGRKVVYDVWDGTNHDLWVTDLKTGASAPLSGGEGGADAAWSPDGKWIVFDRNVMGDNSLYRVSEAGGKPALVMADAIQAAWSPDSKRLVYHRPSDGSLMTSGARGDETLYLAASGAHPAWSPDGRYIAYEDGGAVFRIRVNAKGAPSSEPVQVTYLPGWEGMPAWTADSQTLLLHYGFGGDFDIYSVPAAGGTPAWLTGAPQFGDYDPAMTKTAPYLAYASFSPQGQAQRSWVAALTYDLPGGYWGEGEHSYQWQTGDPEQEAFVEFNVSDDAPIYENYVMLRHNTLSADGGEGCGPAGEIHPSQKTRFVSGWAVEGSYPEALAQFDALGMKVSWDGNAPVGLTRHEILPFNSLDWWSYVCSYTQPAVRSLSVGNFAVEWSPVNVEEISSLRWKGSVNLASSWEHGLYPGSLEYFGNSWVSEGEGEDRFYFRSLVGWGTAGAWTQTGTQVKIGSMSMFTPEPLIPIQTSYRFFDDDKRANLIVVQRSFDFGEQVYTHDIRPYIPRLFPRDGFTQVIHPNTRGRALMTKNAEECENGCEITNWSGAWFAIHNPTTGEGVLVLREPSIYNTSLWVDVDGGSWTNATSVLLKQPAGGFTGAVAETEYLCFYDSSIWVPSNRVPEACLPGPESSLFSLTAELVFSVWLPAINR